MRAWTLVAVGALGALAPVAWWTVAYSAAAGPEPVPAAPPTSAEAVPSTLAAAGTAGAAATVASATEPTPSASAPMRFAHVPDLTQTDPDLGLPDSGNSYCGPVAVSNSLVDIANRACPELLPPGDTAKQRQLELVRKLSSHRYMGTSSTHGTGGIGLLRGLHRYLLWNGCPYRRLAYQGWRGHPPEFSTWVKTPQLEWIRQALDGGGAAWINVGWYTVSPSGRGYRRHGGHWLTVVGAGVDEAGAPDPMVLVLHDPAPYAGTEAADEYARAEPLGAGWLVEGRDAFPARGYYMLTGGMHVKRDGEVAILDGAVTLVL